MLLSYMQYDKSYVEEHSKQNITVSWNQYYQNTGKSKVEMIRWEINVDSYLR